MSKHMLDKKFCLESECTRIQVIYKNKYVELSSFVTKCSVRLGLQFIWGCGIDKTSLLYIVLIDDK